MTAPAHGARFRAVVAAFAAVTACAISAGPRDLRSGVRDVLAGEPAADPESSRTALARLARTGDWTTLLREADRAVSRDGRDVAGWEYRGYALHKLGRLREAQLAYERVVKLDERHVWAWTQLGATRLETDGAAAARSPLERAVALDPAATEAVRKLSRVLRELGATDAALELAAATAKAGRDVAWATLEEASILWAVGRTETAAERLREARERGADPSECDALADAVAFDLPRKPEDRARSARGEPWTFALGGPDAAGSPSGPRVTVVTRVGPSLPEDLVREVRSALARFPEFLGADPGDARVRIELARTLEEHEAVRRERFPAGRTGRAYTERSVRERSADSSGPFLPPVQVVHVVWVRPELARTLRHELCHAILYGSRRIDAQPWLDEGLATYVETWADGAARPLPRADLVDVLTDPAIAPRRLDLRGILTGGIGLDGPDGKLRYAECWSLVRFLAEDPVAGGPERLRRLLRSEPGRDGRTGPGSRGNPLVAFRDVYGPGEKELAELEAAWAASVRALGRE